VVVTGIVWSTWTASAAAGRGIAQVNPCQPTCAARSAQPYPVQAALSDPVASANGPHFRQLTLVWSNGRPFGHPSDSYALPA
jgi:hypothetical protein